MRCEKGKVQTVSSTFPIGHSDRHSLPPLSLLFRSNRNNSLLLVFFPHHGTHIRQFNRKCRRRTKEEQVKIRASYHNNNKHNTELYNDWASIQKLSELSAHNFPSKCWIKYCLRYFCGQTHHDCHHCYSFEFKHFHLLICDGMSKGNSTSLTLWLNWW